MLGRENTTRDAPSAGPRDGTDETDETDALLTDWSERLDAC